MLDELKELSVKLTDLIDQVDPETFEGISSVSAMHELIRGKTYELIMHKRRMVECHKAEQVVDAAKRDEGPYMKTVIMKTGKVNGNDRAYMSLQHPKGKGSKPIVIHHNSKRTKGF